VPLQDHYYSEVLFTTKKYNLVSALHGMQIIIRSHYNYRNYFYQTKPSRNFNPRPRFSDVLTQSTKLKSSLPGTFQPYSGVALPSSPAAPGTSALACGPLIAPCLRCSIASGNTASINDIVSMLRSVPS